MASGATAAINGFAVADRSTAWLVGNGGLVHRTTDGGQGWTAQASNLTAKLNSGVAVSTQKAWIVGNVGAIARTTDGGATWTDMSYATTSDITDIVAIDDQTLIAVGGQTEGAKLALRSTNGGTTWSDVSHASMDNQHAIDMADDTRGWTVGQADFVHRTDDGGLTWTAYPLCTGSQMRGVAALSRNIVVAVGHVGSICRSTDGGQTWSSVTSGTTENLWDVEETADGALWAVTRGTGLVLRSLDQGITWQQVAIANQNLEEIAAFDRDSAWWAGWSGHLTRIPSGSFPEYGSVAGATWSGSAGMFGTCLSQATSATAVWSASAGCPMADGAHWRAVPASTAAPASRVATTASGVSTGEVRLRFGARPPTDQAPGRYVASLVFEVLAPST